MRTDIQLAYLGLEVPDPSALDAFLAEVVGLVPGEPSASGGSTWRDDDRAHRVLVDEGPSNDATRIGIEAADDAVLAGLVARVRATGAGVERGSDELAAARRVDEIWVASTPWGIDVELVTGLAAAPSPYASPLAPGGFLTDGVGFGHVVFATTAFDASHAFLVDGLGMGQSDWVEVELAPGIELEVRFYHCNPRHHTVALAKAPFDLPQKLHHVMFELQERDDVGAAFDRAWASGLPIPNGLGRHDNDGMFSFYVASPAGFQVEIGHGARVVDDGWDDNRRYDRISAWGHQSLRG